MSTFFGTFPGPPPPGSSLRFISYNRPPNQTPRRIRTKKTPSSTDEFPDIDTILGLGPDPNSEQENRKELAHTAYGVEVVDLTCSVDNEASCEINGSGGTNDDVGSGDLTNDHEGVLMPTSQGDTGDMVSRQPSPSESSSQGNVVVIDNNQLDTEADLGDANEEDIGLHRVDRSESAGAPNPAYHDRDVPTSAVDGAKTQVSELPYQRLSSTPPTSPSIMNFDKPTQEAAPCIPAKATTHEQRRSTANKAERRNSRLHSIEITSSGSSSTGSDTDDDDHGGKHTTPQTRKRKRPPLANSASHKRQRQGSNTLLKPSIRRTLASARRQKLFLAQKKALSISASNARRASNARLASAAQASVCDTERSCSEDSRAEGSDASSDWGRHLQKERKPQESDHGSVWYSRSNAENSSTHAQPHANQEMRRSVKGASSQQTQWHLSDIALHSLSDDVSFLTALFRAYSDPGILPSSHALTLLKSTVGVATTLEDITFKPLAPSTWFLTSFAYLVTGTGCRMGQQLSAPSGLPLNRVDTAPLRDCGQLHDDDDVDDDNDDNYDESSNIDYDSNSDNCEHSLSDVVNKPSISRRRIRWSEDDDNRLRQFKNEGKPWSWICDQFPGRSLGAVQVRWHTKLRGKV